MSYASLFLTSCSLVTSDRSDELLLIDSLLTLKHGDWTFVLKIFLIIFTVREIWFAYESRRETQRQTQHGSSWFGDPIVVPEQ